MPEPYTVGLDPVDLERLATYDPRGEIEASLDGLEPGTTSAVDLSDEAFATVVEPLLDRLPEFEADLLHLYFSCGKKQSELATMFSLTQAAISYRITRAVERLKFMTTIPIPKVEDLRRDLAKAFDREVVDVMVVVAMTTCQTETAERLGLSQGRVRHKLTTTLTKLKALAQEDDTYEPYAVFFSALVDKKAYNIMRPINLPQWSAEARRERAEAALAGTPKKAAPRKSRATKPKPRAKPTTVKSAPKIVPSKACTPVGFGSCTENRR